MATWFLKQPEGYTSVGTGRNQAEVAYIISGDKGCFMRKTRQGATTEIISSGQISEAYELLKPLKLKNYFMRLQKTSSLTPHDKALANNTTKLYFWQYQLWSTNFQYART